MVEAEFLKWCNTPMHRDPGCLGFNLRVKALFPDYDRYLIIDKNGNSVFGEGEFKTAEEVFEYYNQQMRVP